MSTPSNLSYTKSHEWMENTGEKRAKIGITDYAQGELGDVVFINLPAVGDTLSLGESFADVESVKAVSDIYSPLSGTVCAVNQELIDAPELLNQEPYSETEELLNAQEYEALLS